MRILAIETSCDDTAIAILEVTNGKTPDFKVLANVVSSQTELHKKYGGVFPAMAKREHQRNLVPVLEQALKLAKLRNPKFKTLNPKQIQNPKFKTIEKILSKESELYKNLAEFLEKYEKPDIDAIAVTHGPGLEPCLWVGVNFAKALASFWNKPIIPVNHIEAHILVNFLENSIYSKSNDRVNLSINFPAVSLIVSGGHTQLILMKGVGKYKIIGETKDDAAGECFDKAARILGLGYPGGPVISEITSRANNPPRPIKLPRPMIDSKDYDFSFSGLKTAILYAVKDRGPRELKDPKFVESVAVEIEQAIVDVLIKKTIKAAKDYKVKTIILGGGVSANTELRKQFIEKAPKEIYSNFNDRENQGIRVIFPEKNLSTDNALMIAVTGYFHKNKKTKAWKKIKVKANLRISK